MSNQSVSHDCPEVPMSRAVWTPSHLAELLADCREHAVISQSPVFADIVDREGIGR